jgi:hypothetical protein
LNPLTNIPFPWWIGDAGSTEAGIMVPTLSQNFSMLLNDQAGRDTKSLRTTDKATFNLTAPTNLSYELTQGLSSQL